MSTDLLDDFEIVEEGEHDDPPPPYSATVPIPEPTASSAVDNTSPRALPSNCAELNELYKTNPDDCKSIYGLVENGLKNGRSFDSIMMMVFGESHSGKSSTINRLFNDNKLCPTNKTRSETKRITIYEKKLLVRETTPPVYAYLRFIDTPGTFDSDGKDMHNLQDLKKFRNESTYLSPADRNTGYWVVRKALSSKIHIRNTLYPNVVLFFVTADAKNEGRSTRIRTSLQVLKQSGVVDTKYPNLVVVVTRAAQLIDDDEDTHEFRKKSYIFNSSELKRIILEVVHETFNGSLNPEVVFVENKFVGCLEKSGDYYQLPDGHTSHYNLLVAIQRCFETPNFNDVLGRLLIATYLDPLCAERNDPPASLPWCSVDGLEQATDALSLHESTYEHIHHDKFNFEYLGRGVCKRDGEIKHTCLLDSHDLKDVVFGNKGFRVPVSLEIREQPSTVITHYSLDDQSFGSKILRNLMGTCNYEAVSHAYVYEKLLAVAKLDSPESVLDTCQALNEAIEKLGSSTVNSFFERWGTHFVVQQAVGGGIYVFYTLDKELDAVRKNALEGYFEEYFRTKNPDLIQQIRKIGVSNERILVVGGTLDSNSFNFESLTSDVLSEWQESVLEEPANLISEIKFFPHYHLLSPNAQAAVKALTNAYLSNKPDARKAIVQAPRDPEDAHLTRKHVAEKMKSNAIEDKKRTEEGGGCFPAGTTVYVSSVVSSNMEEKLIEHLSPSDKLQTVELNSVGSVTTSRMCDYLHYAADKTLEYLVLSFDNGHELVVSELHVMFVMEQTGLKALKAKHIRIGDSCLFCSTDKLLCTPKLVKICRETRSGVFAPLTCSGTFFANGFLVTSYADTDFALAQVAMAPLKLWRSLKSFTHKTEYEVVHEIHPYARFLIKIRSAGANMLK